MHKLKKILHVLMITIAFMFIYTTITKATTVEITTETLNLRKEASTDSDIVALISIGDECEVLGEEGDWYKVQYGEYTGYISKEYAKVVGGSEDDTTSDNSSDSNTDDSDSESKSNKNDNSSKDENTGEDNKGKNDNSNSENTVSEDETSQNSTSETSENSNTNTVAKTIKNVDVRIVPLINGSEIGSLKSGAEVTVINQINGWAYIQNDVFSGWVRADCLNMKNTENSSNGNEDNNKNDDENEKKDTANEKNDSKEEKNNFTEKTMYATDYINIRKEPNTNAEVLMLVETNTALKVVGQEGDWYKVSTSQGEAYVSKDVVSDEKVEVTNRGNIERTKTTEKKTSSSNSSNTSSTKVNDIVSYAKKFLGVPYVYGGASPSGFDCSGFTMYVYNHFGISMRHGAQAQAKLGTTINVDKSSKSSMLNNLKEGDLVFFLDYETMDEIGHCGIYIGDGNFIHASSGSGYCVKINSLLPGEYYNTRYCAARRIL